ncbi:PIN domain-containing protein [Haloechinothrix salitolerans]|uniref:Ribonuclease VapC n=1 Tax=Haloechinothrix salitolerans TaxID=926830 RepID=A0ABW2BZA7_9PSEU
MTGLILDSGPLIATYAPDDRHHVRCAKLLSDWRGPVFLPEAVLIETCGFIRNVVRNGPAYEARLLRMIVAESTGLKIVEPTHGDRRRAADLVERLVSAPFGYVDAMVLATAERLGITNIATVDYKFVGIAASVSYVKPLTFVLSEIGEEESCLD